MPSYPLKHPMLHFSSAQDLPGLGPASRPNGPMPFSLSPIIAQFIYLLCRSPSGSTWSTAQPFSIETVWCLPGSRDHIGRNHNSLALLWNSTQFQHSAMGTLYCKGVCREPVGQDGIRCMGGLVKCTCGWLTRRLPRTQILFSWLWRCYHDQNLCSSVSILEKWLPNLFLKISSGFDLHFLQKANLQNYFCFDSQWFCRIKVIES